MKPRKNYRTRPKKHGAKRRQRILSQKRKLVAAGYDKEKLDKMNSVEIRDLLKKSAEKKTVKKVVKAKPKKKTTAKKKPAKKK